MLTPLPYTNLHHSNEVHFEEDSYIGITEPDLSDGTMENAPILNGERIKAENKTYISATDTDIRFELLHRVSEEEKKHILQTHPTLDAALCFIRDEKDEEKPYKIVLNKGQFSKVRLAKQTHADGTVEYLAVRKIKKFFVNCLSTIGMTKSKLVLQDKLKATNAIGNYSFTLFAIKAKNSEDHEQIYEFLPLADLGDGIDILNRLHEIELSEKEQHIFLRYISHHLLKSVANANKKGLYFTDIKPANILFTSKKEILLADFGAAFYSSEAEQISLRASASTDIRYIHPQAYPIYLQIKTHPQSVQLKYAAIMDTWALALTLLQFSSTAAHRYIYNNIFKCMQLIIDEYQKNPDLDINPYHQTIRTLLHSDFFQTIPYDLQHLFSLMLTQDFNTDQNTVQNLFDRFSEKIKPLTSEEMNTISDIFQKLIPSQNDNLNNELTLLGKIKTIIQCDAYWGELPESIKTMKKWIYILDNKDDELLKKLAGIAREHFTSANIDKMTDRESNFLFQLKLTQESSHFVNTATASIRKIYANVAILENDNLRYQRMASK